MKQEIGFQGKVAQIGRILAGTSMTSAPVNRTGFEYAAIVIACGALADTGDVVVNIQHSDTSGGTYATLVSQALTVSGASAMDNTSIMGIVRLHGAKAFIRASAVVNADTGATGNHTVLVTALLHPGQYAPEDNTNAVLFTYDGPGPGASTS